MNKATATFPPEIIEDIVRYADKGSLAQFCKLDRTWYRISLPHLYKDVPWLDTQRFVHFMASMTLAYRWRYDEFKTSLSERKQLQSSFPMPLLLIQNLVGPVKLHAQSMDDYRKAIDDFAELLRLSKSLSAVKLAWSNGLIHIDSDSNLITQPILMKVLKLCKETISNLSYDNISTEIMEELILLGCPKLEELRVSSERDAFDLYPFESAASAVTASANNGGVAEPNMTTVLIPPARMTDGAQTLLNMVQNGAQQPDTSNIEGGPQESLAHQLQSFKSLKRLAVETSGMRPRYPLINIRIITPVLQQLTLNFVHLTDVAFRSLLVANRSHLASLTLGFVTGLSATAFNTIGVFAPKLKYLNLTYTNAATTSLAHITKECPNLEHVVLVGNHQITDESILAMCENAKNVKLVEFGAMNLTHFAIKAVLDQCPSLAVLSCFELHKITGDNLKELIQDSAGCSSEKIDSRSGSGWSSIREMVWSSNNRIPASALVELALCRAFKSLKKISCKLPDPEELKMSVIPVPPLPEVNYSVLKSIVQSALLERDVPLVLVNGKKL